jgi:hypothetical protein
VRHVIWYTCRGHGAGGGVRAREGVYIHVYRSSSHLHLRAVTIATMSKATSNSGEQLCWVMLTSTSDEYFSPCSTSTAMRTLIAVTIGRWRVILLVVIAIDDPSSPL